MLEKYIKPAIVAAGALMMLLGVYRVGWMVGSANGAWSHVASFWRVELAPPSWKDSNAAVSLRLYAGERAMAVGTVKWFNTQKGYGFIQPQGGGKDVFVHISAVERAGLSTLNEGQRVEFEEVSDRGKTSAGNLKVI